MIYPYQGLTAVNDDNYHQPAMPTKTVCYVTWSEGDTEFRALLATMNGVYFAGSSDVLLAMWADIGRIIVREELI